MNGFSHHRRILGQYLKMRGDDYSLNSENLSFQHDDVYLELAVNNSMLLFENNFKSSDISIELEVLRQNAKNIASITLLFLSKNASLTEKSTEMRANKGITFVQRVGRYCIVASNCIREVSIRCPRWNYRWELMLKCCFLIPASPYELIFPCYICIDPKN